MRQETIDSSLLKILACPDSHQPLRLLEAEELAKINMLISNGGLKTVGGEPCTTPWTAGLIRQDQQRAYQIQDGLPLLLIETSIAVPN